MAAWPKCAAIPPPLREYCIYDICMLLNPTLTTTARENEPTELNLLFPQCQYVQVPPTESITIIFSRFFFSLKKRRTPGPSWLLRDCSDYHHRTHCRPFVLLGSRIVSIWHSSTSQHQMMEVWVIPKRPLPRAGTCKKKPEDES